MTITSAKIDCIRVTIDESTWNERKRYSATHWEDYDGNWWHVRPNEAARLEAAYQAYKTSRPELS